MTMKSERWEMSENAAVAMCIMAVISFIGINLVLHVGSHSIAEAIADRISPPTKTEACHEQL